MIRKTIFMLALFIGAGFVMAALQIWHDLNVIKQNNIFLINEISQTEKDLKRLEMLPNHPIRLMKDSYVQLDQQLSGMNRYYDFKTSIDIKNLGKEGNISDAASQSSWVGIKEMNLNLNFFDLKGVDQYLSVLNFIETIEAVDPLRVLSVIQQNNNLQVELKLYGR
jgi:hypothetical protein